MGMAQESPYLRAVHLRQPRDNKKVSQEQLCRLHHMLHRATLRSVDANCGRDNRLYDPGPNDHRNLSRITVVKGTPFLPPGVCGSQSPGVWAPNSLVEPRVVHVHYLR